AIGVLLCASKDDEVVEYALSRSLSPALIAEYQTQLPDKALLQAKLHEFYLQNVNDENMKDAMQTDKCEDMDLNAVSDARLNDGKQLVQVKLDDL
ncbi:MAG: PDDEXK nuclease domain-containing protein, partial [Gallionella sp.]